MKRNASKLVAESNLAISCSEARRKIVEGAVFLNNSKIQDFSAELQVNPGDMLRVGRKEEMLIQDCGDNIFCCATCDIAESFAKQKRDMGFEVSVTGNMVFVFKQDL